MKNREKSPFKLQSARASWIIPIINMGIMIFGREGFQTQCGALLLGGIVILLFITGIVPGIIGLSGCKQYGAKAAATPAVSGIILNSGLFFLLLSSAVSSFNSARMGG